MVANDNAGYLMPRGVLESIASVLAPTESAHMSELVQNLVAARLARDGRQR